MQKLRAPLLFPLLAALFLGYSIGTTMSSSKTEETVFPPTPTRTKKQISSTVPDRLLIPTLGLNLPILDMPITGGTWAVPETAVGRGADRLLFAHRRVRLFKRISTLGPNQWVYLQKGDGTTTAYKPHTTLLTTPSDLSLLDAWPHALLLVTCEGSTDQWRTIVVAIPLEGLEYE